MNQISESIMKSTQTMEFVVQDLAEALKAATAIMRPEGRNLADKATMAYLADCLELARQLQTKLERIA